MHKLKKAIPRLEVEDSARFVILVRPVRTTTRRHIEQCVVGGAEHRAVRNHLCSHRKVQWSVLNTHYGREAVARPGSEYAAGAFHFQPSLGRNASAPTVAKELIHLSTYLHNVPLLDHAAQDATTKSAARDVNVRVQVVGGGEHGTTLNLHDKLNAYVIPVT